MSTTPDTPRGDEARNPSSRVGKLGVLGAGLLAAGCATTGEMEAIKQKVDALQADVASAASATLHLSAQEVAELRGYKKRFREMDSFFEERELKAAEEKEKEVLTGDGPESLRGSIAGVHSAGLHLALAIAQAEVGAVHSAIPLQEKTKRFNAHTDAVHNFNAYKTTLETRINRARKLGVTVGAELFPDPDWTTVPGYPELEAYLAKQFAKGRTVEDFLEERKIVVLPKLESEADYTCTTPTPVPATPPAANPEPPSDL
ncbi:MAG: hypothetical protein Q8P95_03570 [bacterium]|nr:hypothetical protein [bacterium]